MGVAASTDHRLPRLGLAYSLRPEGLSGTHEEKNRRLDYKRRERASPANGSRETDGACVSFFFWKVEMVTLSRVRGYWVKEKSGICICIRAPIINPEYDYHS